MDTSEYYNPLHNSNKAYNISFVPKGRSMRACFKNTEETYSSLDNNYMRTTTQIPPPPPSRNVIFVDILSPSTMSCMVNLENNTIFIHVELCRCPLWGEHQVSELESVLKVGASTLIKCNLHNSKWIMFTVFCESRLGHLERSGLHADCEYQMRKFS